MLSNIWADAVREEEPTVIGRMVSAGPPIDIPTFKEVYQNRVLYNLLTHLSSGNLPDERYFARTAGPILDGQVPPTSFPPVVIWRGTGPSARLLLNISHRDSDLVGLAVGVSAKNSADIGR